MKHVRMHPNGKGGMSVVVDGTDVSGFVNADGMAIEFKNGRAHVWLPVAPVMFAGEFPEAVVNALQGTRPDLDLMETKISEAAARPCNEGCPLAGPDILACPACIASNVRAWVESQW